MHWENQYRNWYCGRKTKACNFCTNALSSQRKVVFHSSRCKWKDLFMHMFFVVLFLFFFFCFRCLEMLLRVQWQKNFLTSCSLPLKCHGWWWPRFDGEHQISPQVLHGSQVWALRCALWISDQSEHYKLPSTAAVQAQKLKYSQWKCIVFCFFGLKEEKAARVFLPGLLWQLISTNMTTHHRERNELSCITCY